MTIFGLVKYGNINATPSFPVDQVTVSERRTMVAYEGLSAPEIERPKARAQVATRRSYSALNGVGEYELVRATY